jgi:hypothetical protein
MLDGFDHGREEGEPGDERTSLLGENIEGGREGRKSGEQDGEFWDRSCSEESMMSDVGSQDQCFRATRTRCRRCPFTSRP